MLKNQTALILGAGASRPYGYPLGTELRNQILEDSDERDHVIEKVGWTRNKYVEMRTTLLRTQFSCVDDFLEKYPEHAALMKFLIAYQLNLAEDVNRLLDPRKEDHWYYRLLVDFLGDKETLGDGRLKVITFNYDLSLEAYLYHTLLTRHRVSAVAARNAIASLQITHIHGDLGPLSETCGEGRAYGKFTSPEIAYVASQNITTCHERAAREAAAQAQELISQSDRIALLGFGFSEQNLDFLQLEKCTKDGAAITASVVGCRHAKKALARRVGNRVPVTCIGDAATPFTTQRLLRQILN